METKTRHIADETTRHEGIHLLAGTERGDQSNLRGTDYHLLYAVWLLIRNQAERIHFFKGNDLLAEPAAPPDPLGKTTFSASAVSSAGDEDNWIQLKCTKADWTASRLLDGNLLGNFICNSFFSESTAKGRDAYEAGQAVWQDGLCCVKRIVDEKE